MKTLAEINSDISIDGGDFKIATGKYAYAVILKDAICTCLGEIQLNENLGIPYFETIFRSVGMEDVWRYYVKQQIRAFDFVKSLDSMNVNIDCEKKTLSYTATISTDLGVVEISN